MYVYGTQMVTITLMVLEKLTQLFPLFCPIVISDSSKVEKIFFFCVVIYIICICPGGLKCCFLKFTFVY